MTAHIVGIFLIGWLCLVAASSIVTMFASKDLSGIKAASLSADRICISICFAALFLGGCAGSNAEIRAQQHYERTAASCQHGKVVIPRTGTRIRRTYDPDELARAGCSK